MRLFIAEKPSLGRAIAQYLSTHPKSIGSPATHIECGEAVVTWCFGHLLEMATPEEYDVNLKRWAFETLPIIPPKWQLIPRGNVQNQINTIKTLLTRCTEIIHAGDPDREGQLLVDEVLEYLGNTKPVKRIWLASLDETSVKKALNSLKDNQDFTRLKQSAESRQRGDWLVGMNLTRAWTLAGRKKGYENVISIGRVQTPTLAIVVNRDLTIENFVPKDFYAVKALLAHTTMEFAARWRPGDDVTVDESGRVLKKEIADSVAAKVTGKMATVTKYEAAQKKQAAPLPYSLSTLQSEANKKFGYSAQEVADICQALYENKLTTYPRTDCQYLPESQFKDSPRILAALPDAYKTLVSGADTKLKSAAWNEKKITAHHAIIPNGTKVQGTLSKQQQDVFDLIVRAYLAQFYPPFTYQQTTITLHIEGEEFAASGKVPLKPGWKQVYDVQPEEEKEKDDDGKQSLPTLTKGETLPCKEAVVETKKTTPPARFTEGTLIQAMTNIHQLAEDPEIKKRLKETAGIGTEATRAGILETLKKRGFLTVKGKQIISTKAGRDLAATLPKAIKSPGLTGLFEQLLDGISEGTITPEEFIEKQVTFVRKYIEQAKLANLPFADTALPCPKCKQGVLKRVEGSKGAFFGCTRFKEGCRATFDDKDGKPALPEAPKASAVPEMQP